MSIRFKLDENLPRRVEPALRVLGHDVETAISEGLAGSPDPNLLSACDTENRILVAARGGTAVPESAPLVYTSDPRLRICKE